MKYIIILNTIIIIGLIGTLFTIAKDVKSMQASIEQNRIQSNDTAVATSITFTYLNNMEDFRKYTELYLQELKKANIED